MKIVIGNEVMEILYGGRMVQVFLYLNRQVADEEINEFQQAIMKVMKGPKLYLATGMLFGHDQEGLPMFFESLNSINTIESEKEIGERVRAAYPDGVIKLHTIVGMEAKRLWREILTKGKDMYENTKRRN